MPLSARAIISKDELLRFHCDVCENAHVYAWERTRSLSIHASTRPYTLLYVVSWQPEISSLSYTFGYKGQCSYIATEISPMFYFDREISQILNKWNSIASYRATRRILGCLENVHALTTLSRWIARKKEKKKEPLGSFDVRILRTRIPRYSSLLSRARDARRKFRFLAGLSAPHGAWSFSYLRR